MTEDNLWELVPSFYYVGPGVKLRFPMYDFLVLPPKPLYTLKHSLSCLLDWLMPSVYKTMLIKMNIILAYSGFSFTLWAFGVPHSSLVAVLVCKLPVVARIKIAPCARTFAWSILIWKGSGAVALLEEGAGFVPVRPSSFFCCLWLRM